MIYSRFGEPVTIVRKGVLEDVRKFDGRKPDKQDRACVEAGSYVIVRFGDGGEQLYHQGFLRADDGSAEITKALEAVQS